jgi:putative acetyltransferase
MHGTSPQIVIQPFAEAHLEGITALYNEPSVCRQVLQMPYQSVEVWRSRTRGPITP